MPARRLQTRRRVKRAAGLEGIIPNVIPDKPSFASILRQLLAGIFSPTRSRQRQIIKKEYEWTTKGRKQMHKDIKQAYYQAAHVTTAQAALTALGEIIYSTPIVSSRLAQNWALRVARGAKAYKSVVAQKNHEQVFLAAQREFQPELEKVKRSAEKMSRKTSTKVDIDLHLSNPTPYLNQARTDAYWRVVIQRAWSYQRAQLQKIFERNARKLGL